MSNSVSTKTLNILKAALPFVPAPMQRNLSYFVKIEEFNNMFNNFSDSIDSTLSACELNENGNNSNFNMSDFIYAIRPYLDKKEFDTITTFMNFFNAYNIYQSISSISGNNSSLLNLVQSLGGNGLNTNPQPNITENAGFNPQMILNNGFNLNNNPNPGSSFGFNSNYNSVSDIAKLIHTLNPVGTNHQNSFNGESVNNNTNFQQQDNMMNAGTQQNDNMMNAGTQQHDNMMNSSIEALNSLLDPNINQNLNKDTN